MFSSSRVAKQRVKTIFMKIQPLIVQKKLFQSKTEKTLTYSDPNCQLEAFLT